MTPVLQVVAFLVKASLVVSLLLLARGLAWLFNLLVIAPLSDPLRHMPGPVTSTLGTHFSDVLECVKLFRRSRSVVLAADIML
jgi:hypothetical protein